MGWPIFKKMGTLSPFRLFQTVEAWSQEFAGKDVVNFQLTTYLPPLPPRGFRLLHLFEVARRWHLFAVGVVAFALGGARLAARESIFSTGDAAVGLGLAIQIVSGKLSITSVRATWCFWISLRTSRRRGVAAGPWHSV